MAELNTKSDAELLALSAREPRAFAILVDRYQTAFIRRACRVLRDTDEAEDAVQDAFVRIYLHASKFSAQEGATFQSWAYKVLMNVCLTRYRRRERRQSRFVAMGEDELNIYGQTDDLGFDSKLKLDYAISLIAALPTVLKRMMTLHYLHDWSYEKLAEVEGVSPGTIRSRIHRAKKFLNDKFYERRDD